jgi:hypothetical protein
MNDLDHIGFCEWCKHPGSHARAIEAGRTEAPCPGCPQCEDARSNQA